MSQTIHNEVVTSLCILAEDPEASKLFKGKVKSTIDVLKSGQDLAIDKAILELEELSSYVMSSYHRTQLWDVISLLESMK